MLIQKVASYLGRAQCIVHIIHIFQLVVKCTLIVQNPRKMDASLLKLNKDVYGGLQSVFIKTRETAKTGKEPILWLMWKSVVQKDGSSPGAVFNLAAVWQTHLYALIRSKMLPPPLLTSSGIPIFMRKEKKKNLQSAHSPAQPIPHPCME